MEFIFPTGEVMLYDACDDPVVRQYWGLLRLIKHHHGYKYPVVSIITDGPYYTVRTVVSFSQILLGVPRDTSVVHLNGDVLDNRRENLLATMSSKEASLIRRRRLGFRCGVRKIGVDQYEAWIAPEGEWKTVGIYSNYKLARKMMHTEVLKYNKGVE